MEDSAAVCGSREGQPTEPTPVDSQEAETVVLELLFPVFNMFKSLALPQTVPSFLRSCDILLQALHFSSSPSHLPLYFVFFFPL